MSIYASNYAPEQQNVVFTDFEQILSSSPTWVGGFNTTIPAGASVTAGTATSNQHGVIQLNAGTAVSVILSKNAKNVVLGNGTFEVRANVQIPVLSNSTDTFFFRVGLNSATDGTAATNAVVLEYSSATDATSTGAGNWVAKTVSSGTATQINLGVTVATSSWYQLKFVVNSLATRVDFYVSSGGVQLGTGFSTSNIPTSALTEIISLYKTNGTDTGNYALVDYFFERFEFTTYR